MGMDHNDERRIQFVSRRGQGACRSVFEKETSPVNQLLWWSRLGAFDLWRIGLLASSLALSGCTTYYHVSEIDDHKPGRVSLEEFAEESRGRHVEVGLSDGSLHYGVNLEVTAGYTHWCDSLTGAVRRIANDSVTIVSWKSWSRGLTDGLLLGVSGGFLSMLSFVGAPYYALVAWPYVLTGVPAIGAIIGACVTHTYRYRIESQAASKK
jgi:hypothetical protein